MGSSLWCCSSSVVFAFFFLAARVAEAPLTPFLRRLAAAWCSLFRTTESTDFPAFYIRLTIKPTRQQNSTLSLFTRYSHAHHARLTLTYRSSCDSDTSA